MKTGAETTDECRLRLLPRADFLKILQRDPESSAGVASLLAAELAAAHCWIGNTTLARSAAARLANYLLRCSSPELAALTHMELSLRIGVSREAVSRILQGFKASGALSPLRGSLAVRDRTLLEQAAS